MIAKNLIILLVLVVVVAIAIWAWFSGQTSADASGISVQSISSGIKVSWDGKDYYDELTARTQEEVTGEIGLAKSLYDGETPSPLKLITGNGTEFFEPFLNRRMGTVLLNNDNSWQGQIINSKNSSGKFIDIDLYFQNDSAKNVYLAGDSWVSPTSEDNLSAYGNFSKDYISAATRVAFLNADKSVCNFVWAPNADIELKEGDGGYTKVTDVKTETISSSSGATLPVEILMDSKGENDYQFWFPSSYDEDKFAQSSEMNNWDMEYKTFGTQGKGLFIFELTMNPSARNGQPTFPFMITAQGDNLTSDDVNTYFGDLADRNANSVIKYNDNNALVRFSDNHFNVEFENGTYAAPAFFLNSNEIVSSRELKITIGYNPIKKEVIILGYSNENGVSYDRTGTGGGNTEVKYYELENPSTTVALVNTASSLAVSLDSANEYQKAISFSNIEKTNIQTSVITANEMLTATKTGSGYDATYTFKSSDNKFLNVADDGTVSFTNTATEFSLAYVEGFAGPVIKSGNGKCIAFSDGSLKAVALGKLSQSEFVTVFTGSGYELLTNSTASQDYKYYSSTQREELTLTSTSKPPLFTSTTKDSASKIIGKRSETDMIPVAELTKTDDSEQFYKAHIVMRIWVEGTDREAKTPLADGMFKTSFHFVSQ